ncbi:MAG: hypothetical protein EBX41_00950 [Chitinophagia bacterium]|nr:hypothetical protein [Chitinophagia bacterium]
MSIPKEPRQIMINLMYLVLTALLALNVSNEILNAFKTLSSSINKSNTLIEQRNQELYTQIKESEKEKGQAEKVRPYRIKADEVVKRTDAFIAYIENWKKRIVDEAGGYEKPDEHSAGDTTEKWPAKMDNIDATTSLLCDREAHKGYCGGDTLKDKITEFREWLLSQVPGDSAALSKSIPIQITPVKKNKDHNPNGDWSIGNFEHMPAIAALALFSKFENDARSSEAIIIKRLAELAHTKEIKFDSLVAIAVPKTTYALQGDKIEANILLAAFSTANKPEISIQQGGGSTKPIQSGVFPWETTASGTGVQTVKGVLNFEAPGQAKKAYPWTFEYFVGTTGASMGLDKMNVCYIGVPNPVTVTAAGYAIEDVFLTLPAGSEATQTGSNGHFELIFKKPTLKGQDLVIDIMAKPKDKNAAPIKVGMQAVRVKRIPDPVVLLMGKRDGVLLASSFRVAIAPIAKLENFEFAADFRITSFEFSMYIKGAEIVGPYKVKDTKIAKFSNSPDVIKVMSKAKAGDKVFIENIKGVGPDNVERSLGSSVFTLN